MLRFDGSSYVTLPNNLIEGSAQNETIEAWFQTTSGGVILGYQQTAPPASPGDWFPALWVGS